MRNFAELSWLVEFCERGGSPDEVYGLLPSNPAHPWIVDELMAFFGDVRLVSEVHGIYDCVDSEHQVDGGYTAEDVENSSKTLAPMLAALMQPFVSRRRSEITEAIELVRQTRIPPPATESTGAVEFGDSIKVGLRYWTWGPPRGANSTAVLYHPDDGPVDAAAHPCVFDLLDVMRPGEIGTGSLHRLHQQILQSWPELGQYPRWFLRARYSSFGRRNEVWLRFTDGAPVPVKVVACGIAGGG